MLSQKYYKLKKESKKLAGTTSANATPVKAEAGIALTKLSPARGRKRKMKEEDETEKKSGSIKRTRKASLAPISRRQNGVYAHSTLEDGGVPWTSDDETALPKQIALGQDI